MSHRISLSFMTIISCLLVPQMVSAASIDLRNQDLQGGGGYGNTLEFTNSDVTLNVTGFSETGARSPAGSLFYKFEAAEVYSWGSGIGVCNQHEGTAGVNCNNAEHEVDTLGRDDLLVFEFDTLVEFESLVVDPFNNSGSDANDRDIIYWVGTIDGSTDLASVLSNETFQTLDDIPGFSDETLSAASSSFNPFSHTLNGIGNVLLVSGDYHDLSCTNQQNKASACEAYKVAEISYTVVPVPAAMWLMGSAMLALLGIRIRR